MENSIYFYDDNISFRQCNIGNSINNLTYGDCTCFYTQEENWKTYYYCKQYGIHLHCRKHTAQELIQLNDSSGYTELKCPICNNIIEIDNFDNLLQNCLKLLNAPKFKNAKLFRLNDWYVPEIKEKMDIDSNYWITTQVKKDKDNHTIIILYVGEKGTTDKVQYFIKPEKLQLSNDHKDLDPATILSKIEVTLKDRTLTQKYDDNNI